MRIGYRSLLIIYLFYEACQCDKLVSETPSTFRIRKNKKLCSGELINQYFSDSLSRFQLFSNAKYWKWTENVMNDEMSEWEFFLPNTRHSRWLRNHFQSFQYLQHQFHLWFLEVTKIFNNECLRFFIDSMDFPSIGDGSCLR